MTRLADRLVDRGLPDPVLRGAIRLLLSRRRAAVRRGGVEAIQARKGALVAELRGAPVALATEEANDQHYEVPTELFELMLGRHLKYSSGYWPDGVRTLDEAEEAMLRLTCQRARLADGQDVLELGCGWGSLTLWIAERYPGSRITAVSNSGTQRDHIEKQAALRGLDNVRVVTCDVNVLGTGDTAEVVAGGFDRVVSVEMFEHVRNYEVLLGRIASWLRPAGELFVHHFSHREAAYPFDTGRRGDWMARNFFTDGLMPSHDLLLRFAGELVVDDHWAVSGQHYARTCEAWLARLDAERPRVLQLFADTYGAPHAEAWFNRWRVFTLACAELFATRGGDEWFVTHLRLVRP